jgi:hypothetical protein
MKLSYNQIREMINTALPDAYIVDLFDDSVVYELKSNQYFQCSYAIVDGKLQMGQQVAVQKKVTYEKMQAAASLLAAVGDPKDENYGYVWDVQVIRYGMAKGSNIYWDKAPFVAAMPSLEGSKVFLIRDGQHIRPGGPRLEKSAAELVGWLAAWKDTGPTANAELHLLPSAKDLRDDLLALQAAGMLEADKPIVLGLSVDVDGDGQMKMLAGKRVKWLTKVDKVQVDVVHDPTNEGKFLKMVAAAEADQKEEVMFKKFLAALMQMRPALKAQIEAFEAKGDQATDEEMKVLLAAAMPEQNAGDIDKLIAALKPGGFKDLHLADDAEVKKLLAAAEAKFAETTKLLACASKLGTMLAAEAKLPDYAKMRVKAQFDGRIFEDAQLQAAITSEKEYLDKVQAAAGFIDLPGGDRQMLIMGSGERMQAALDKMMGVKVPKELENEMAFEGLRAAYVRMTGDVQVRGILDPGQMRKLQAAGFDSSTFAYALGNTLYRIMARDYAEAPDFGLSLLISNERNAKDFRTMEAIKIGYFGDLPVVENVAQDGWPDLGILSDEDVSYALGQQGGIITITRVMIINDDIGAVTKIMSRLPRAARITRARKAWNLLLNNAVYTGDNKAVFHADHNNLGSTAIASAEILVARTNMRKQTEPGSGNRIYIPNKSEILVIPSDLWGTSVGINQQRPVVGTPNPLFQYFGASEERIFENILMTDVNDWMLLANPKDVDIAEIAYLNGVKEPEMFVANNPAAGQMFYNDQLQYKIRQEDAVTLLDYRGVYKEVVAG